MDVPIVVIGAGASGIGAAIQLKRRGMNDFVVLEKAHEIGGTWRDNTYPGCACDVPSALYSFSFAPNPEWSRAFATQPEIRRYLTDTASRYGVREHIRCGVQVLDARWNAATSRWDLATTEGRHTAQILIAGTGPWHEPRIPDVPGLTDFPGEMFHSARWNHDYDLTGKRVAVIGTGASAVQFVPAIRPQVGTLHLFQRTAQWVLPKPDHYVSHAERWLLRNFPSVQRALRAAEYAGMEALGVGFRHPQLLRLVQKIGLLHLRYVVKDPGLRRALKPDYTLGCKRLLLSNTYYRSLTKPNVHVHPTAARTVEGRTVVGADGSRSEVDAIIFGTGFHILDMPIASRVRDAAGRTLNEIWQGSPQAYLGTSVSGFPNLFLLLGPNLGTGHTSAFTILESQLAYVMDAVQAIRRNKWSSMDVRQEIQDAYNTEVQRALRTTVYNAGGCSSYYLDSNGRNSFSWPWSTPAMTRRIRDFDPAAHQVTPL
ncbi:MAG: NAD(P)/FAD-dependent oxidoreductase [Kibdelosporangium sp.]